jgi:hypothetical protein
MRRSIYKGKYSNHTMRIYKNINEKKYEYKSDRFLCNRTRCIICGKNNKKQKTIENNSRFWNYYI